MVNRAWGSATDGMVVGGLDGMRRVSETARAVMGGTMGRMATLLVRVAVAVGSSSRSSMRYGGRGSNGRRDGERGGSAALPIRVGTRVGSSAALPIRVGTRVGGIDGAVAALATGVGSAGSTLTTTTAVLIAVSGGIGEGGRRGRRGGGGRMHNDGGGEREGRAGVGLAGRTVRH